MKKRIHVNQHIIRSNREIRRNAFDDTPLRPPLTVKTYKENIKAHEVEINGPSKVVYSPDKPLDCGATVWIETDASVDCITNVRSHVRGGFAVRPHQRRQHLA